MREKEEQDRKDEEYARKLYEDEMKAEEDVDRKTMELV